MEKKLRESVGSKKVISHVDESIKFMVEYFNSKYFGKYTVIAELPGTLNFMYEFDNYYVFSLTDIYTAIYHNMPKEAIIWWYNSNVVWKGGGFTLLRYFNTYYK